MRLSILLALTACLLSVAGSAQDLPLPAGDGFTWERLGTPPFDANFLTVAPDGSLWSGGVSIEHESAMYVYDEDADTWRDTTALPGAPDNLAFLGPDTLLVRYANSVRLSADSGQTWEVTYRSGGQEILLVAPLGLPHSGGRVLARGNDRHNPHTEGLAYSTDRGASFTESVYDPALFGTDDIRAWTALVVTRGPHAGRVLMGGIHGIAYSDDGGESFQPSSLWALYRYGAGEIAEGEGPEGQPRLFAITTDATRAYEHVTYSDDGGATWSELVTIPEPRDGVGDDGELVWLGPAGQPRSVLAVLPRGHIYRTDDGGGSWSVAGRAPFDSSAVRVTEAYVDEVGRLVVSTPHLAGPVHGVFRTVEPLPVASTTEVPASPRLGVTVEPNPATGRAVVRWEQSEAGTAWITVHDVRGREVFAVADGPRSAGEQSAEVDTSVLAPGVYLVRVVTEAGEARARLTVAR